MRFTEFVTELDKKTIKKAHKTADKILDKPKAKSSIAKWAKDKGMDPEGAVYAIATNMAKKKKNEADDKEQMKGFDPDTVRALMTLKKKFPHANDPLDALLKQVTVNDRDSDTNDFEHDLEFKRLQNKIKDLEQQVNRLKQDN